MFPLDNVRSRLTRLLMSRWVLRHFPNWGGRGSPGNRRNISQRSVCHGGPLALDGFRCFSLLRGCRCINDLVFIRYLSGSRLFRRRWKWWLSTLPRGILLLLALRLWITSQLTGDLQLPIELEVCDALWSAISETTVRRAQALKRGVGPIVHGFEWEHSAIRVEVYLVNFLNSHVSADPQVHTDKLG